jgi:hypothetical protein
MKKNGLLDKYCFFSHEQTDFFLQVNIYFLLKTLVHLIHVRFQVLTATSMMFRAVFWVVLPCKLSVDNHFTSFDTVLFIWIINSGTCKSECKF